MRKLAEFVAAQGGLDLASVQSLSDVQRLATQRMFLLIREPKPFARQCGSADWHEGKSRTDNPFVAGTADWASWDAGWDFEMEANS